MAVTYTTSNDVADLIRSCDFTACTTPTLLQVEEIINRKEDIIDQRTGHTYGRVKTITREYHDLPLVYTYGWGTPIYLQHRDVRVALDCCCDVTLGFSAACCDKLEFYNAGAAASTNNFSDITACTGNYEIIGERGELYLRATLFTILRTNRVRVTYRYGSDTVPNDIKDATTKMTALDLINGSFRMDIIPMGADGAKIMDTSGRWRDDIDRIVRNREEVFVLP